jgi:hypothetical protein
VIRRAVAALRSTVDRSMLAIGKPTLAPTVTSAPAAASDAPTSHGPVREIPSPLKDMVWTADPMTWALEQSRWRKSDELPPAFCIEVGRRLLLAQLEFSEWVLRRVEKVQFDQDRSVKRDIAVNLSVHHEAPIFIDADGREQYLVPLSMMRRRTLVNMDLRDEDGKTLTMLGIRLTQQLDESILLAAAATDSAVRSEHWPRIHQFIKKVVAAPYEEVSQALTDFDETSDTADLRCLNILRQNSLFCATLNRLRENFTLYVLLDKEKGRQRLLRMGFNEPMEWSHQVPLLEKQPENPSWIYRPGEKVPWHERGHILSALGLRPTRVRLQIPCAEYAASYHLEFTAPEGVRVVEAALLAGRPNDPDRHVSADHIVGHSPTIGLHAVEIPNGSLCRAQVDLRIPARGWLTTVALGAIAIAALQTAVAWEWWARSPHWSPEEITNVVLILVTASAAVITLVAQQEFRSVAARLVTAVRLIGAVLTALPIVTAILLVFSGLEKLPRFFPSERYIFLGIAIVAVALTCLNLAGWFGSWRDDRRMVIKESPWDMTTGEPHPTIKNFTRAIQEYGFARPSIGIRSAEGWHEFYDWCDVRQHSAIIALSPSVFWRNLSQTSEPIELAATCTHHAKWAGCEARAVNVVGKRGTRNSPNP